MPMRKSNWIHEKTHVEVSEYLQADDIVLVPFGATEQHGAHAPIMLDTIWATAAAEAAAHAANVLIAPPTHFGWSHSHMGYAGTITLGAETIINLVLDICRSLVIHGFRKLILINGNRMVLQPFEIAAVKLRVETGAFVAVVDAGLIAKSEIEALCTSGPGALGHAGEAETSMILDQFPQFTDMSRALDGTGTATHSLHKSAIRRGHLQLDPKVTGNTVFTPTTAAELTAATLETKGVRGDATAASPEKGKQIVAAIAANLAGLIDEIRPLNPTVTKPAIPV